MIIRQQIQMWVAVHSTAVVFVLRDAGLTGIKRNCILHVQHDLNAVNYAIKIIMMMNDNNKISE